MSQENQGAMTPGMVAKQAFGEQTLERTAEVQTAGMVAHEQAAVQARYVMAERKPRDEDTYRARLLKDCRRPHFAASAMFRVPRGGSSIEGLSIRFAEAAVRAMGNIWVKTVSVFEDQQKRITRVTVTDLENSSVYEKDVNVAKIIERSKPGPQGYVSVRTNSRGQAVYLIKASDDEMMVRENAMLSKALRVLLLRFVPAWLQDECIEVIKETRMHRDAVDPDTAKRRLLDAFAEIRVLPESVVDYLGHGIDHCSQDEIAELRAVFTAVKDNETSWTESLAAKVALRSTLTEKKPEEKKGEAQKPINRGDEILSRIMKEGEDAKGN